MNPTCVLLVALLGLTAQQPVTVELTFAKSITAEPFTGRVFVIASKTEIRENDPPPRLAWFTPYPFFAQDVVKWPAEKSLRFEPTVGLPAWDQLPKGKYWLQAVMDRDLGGPNFHGSPGNAYSKPIAVDTTKPPAEPIKLVIERVIPEKEFESTRRVKYVEMASKLLSDFHGKPTKLRAGIVLPPTYDREAFELYPVVYEVPGFGGNHFAAFNAEARKATNVAGVEVIHAVLDPSCRTGHHVFADSANNGPYGKALTTEFIPYLEKQLRVIRRPSARLLTGHSSGGWCSLWLQVTYPDFFGGVWATAPDPVDFRDFQKVNIYEPKQNLFFDEKGEPRPLARKGDKILLRYKPFNDMEVVMGRGGQLQSFEAVFSPRGKDGKPMPLWDRTTGVIDPAVAKAWQRYDIRMILEKNWDTLGPKLAGKLHLYMGAEDTFYLEGATKLLQESLKKLKSDAVVEIVPKRDHGNLVDAKLRERMAREMAKVLRK